MTRDEGLDIEGLHTERLAMQGLDMDSLDVALDMEGLYLSCLDIWSLSALQATIWRS